MKRSSSLTRPSRVPWSGLVLLAALLCSSALTARAASSGAAHAPTRPNIVFLLTDDQRWDTLGCTGNGIIQTPNLDALAQHGVRFRNAFVTTPICAASRASLLSGTYERTHRFTFNTPPLRRHFVEQSYPVLLRRAGYRTGFVGKLGVDLEPGDPERMFHSFVPLNRNPYLRRMPDGRLRHVTSLTGDHAVRFLDSVPPGQPFCLSVSFNAPHAEDSDPRQYIWGPEFDRLYRDAVFPTPRTMSAQFIRSQPDFLNRTMSRALYQRRFGDPEKYQEMVRGYYRMISGVDRVVGRMKQELRKRGLHRNTVIVFSSDNGYFLGERGFADKWFGYEQSIRVPMVVYDPRLPLADRGRVVERMALNVDVAPTLLELAGLQAPTSMQGRSLLPLVRGETPKAWRTEFFFEHLFDYKDIPKSEGIRTERCTYIRWFEQEPAYEELYRHVSDPDQTRNLAKEPQYQPLLARMRSSVDALRDSYGGPYRPWPRRQVLAAIRAREAREGKARPHPPRPPLRRAGEPSAPARSSRRGPVRATPPA